MRRSIQIFIMAATACGLSACGGTMHEDAAKRLEGSDLPAAIKELRLWTQDEPDSFRAHLLLGKALLKQGDTKEAEAELRTAALKDIKSTEGHQFLGECLIKNGALDDAKKEFEIAAIYDPQSLIPLYGEALVLDAKGDFKGAVVKLREVIQKDPKNLDAHKNLALILAKQGDTVAARTEQEAYEKLQAQVK